MSNKQIFTSIEVNDLISLISEAIQKEITLLTPSLLPKNQISEEFLTRKEVCEILKISFPTLDRLAKNTTLLPYRINSQIRYKKSEVETCLTASIFKSNQTKKGSKNA
jgi:excisionase family DNA binding protein